eukprot:COSAG03_NODE_2884_length_2380_cov_2.118808_2_plen_104_part_00
MADLVAVLSEGPRAQSCAPAINEHLLRTKRLFCRITLSGGGKIQSIAEDKYIHCALNLQLKSLFGGVGTTAKPRAAAAAVWVHATAEKRFGTWAWHRHHAEHS